MFRTLGAIFAVALIAQSATAAEQDQSKKRICKEEAKTGSHMVRKVCRTAAEWKALADQAREDQEAVSGFGRKGAYGSYNEYGLFRGPPRE